MVELKQSLQLTDSNTIISQVEKLETQRSKMVTELGQRWG